MQFSWPPSRQLTGIGGALAIAVAAAYIAAVRDDFEAVLFAIGAAGLLLAGYQALPRRPRLELTFSEDGRSLEAVTVAGDETLRPLDLDSILRHESKAAWATAPARPDPQRSFGSAFIAHSLMGPTDENYAEFDAQVNAYLAEVRSWLSEADRRRRAKLHELHTDLRLTNSGEVAATNVRVRLRFPRGWAEIEDDAAEEPPSRATWNQVVGLFRRPRLSPIRLPFVPQTEPARGGLAGPVISRDSEALVVEYTTRHLSSGLGDTSAYPIQLQAPAAGALDIPYELFADGLPQAQSGTLRVQVYPVHEAGQPITRLDDFVDLDDED